MESDIRGKHIFQTMFVLRQTDQNCKSTHCYRAHGFLRVSDPVTLPPRPLGQPCLALSAMPRSEHQRQACARPGPYNVRSTPLVLKRMQAQQASLQDFQLMVGKRSS